MNDKKQAFELGDVLDVSRYTGAPWRSRFLRAPKIALELADRSDFVELEKFATLKLGLKTGADDFFFLERMDAKPVEKQLISRRGAIEVRGYDSWRGELSSGDVIPAVLNPHQLSGDDGRIFTIPKDHKSLYLYPKSGKLKFGLSEYVRLGELSGINQGKLVQSNGSESAWFKQSRALVRSEWVLPYNSAYDYGAWYNPHGAVINGRFVGVDANCEVHSELLGAVLNSTFAAIGRLLVGVATGVEGAFDVGPPSARKICLPDVRIIDQRNADIIASVIRDIGRENRMIPAPSRDGSVAVLRRKLDAAILVGLGQSPGKAAALLDRLYQSYGRWRASIEDVEQQMRANRRNMNEAGVNRNQRPIESAGKLVWEELEHGVRMFPRQFLAEDEVVEIVNVPASAYIPETEPLFEQGAIRTKTKIIDLIEYSRVRYVLMLRTIGMTGNIEIPVSVSRAGAVVDLFDQDVAKFKKLAALNAVKYVSGKGAVDEVVALALKHWFAACRKSALAPKKQQSQPGLN